MVELWMWQSQQDYDDWINELFQHTPESYDDDASAESILVAYVRNLEGLVDWLLDDAAIVIDDYEGDIRIFGRALPGEFFRLVKGYAERHLPEAQVDGDVLIFGPAVTNG